MSRKYLIFPEKFPGFPDSRQNLQIPGINICSVMFVQTFSVYTVRHALIFWWGSCRTGRPRDGNRVTTGDIYTGGGAVLVHCQACDDMK